MTAAASPDEPRLHDEEPDGRMKDMPRHGALRLWEPPEEPDPGHVLTWRQRLVLRAIKTS